MKFKPKMSRVNFKIVSLFTSLNMKVTVDTSDSKENGRVFIEQRKKSFHIAPILV
jgi:hypothetical protein